MFADIRYIGCYFFVCHSTLIAFRVPLKVPGFINVTLTRSCRPFTLSRNLVGSFYLHHRFIEFDLRLKSASWLKKTGLWLG